MSEDRPAIIETVGLKKVFKGATDYLALRGVDIRIEQGELVSIVGASGSGKSTLLYLLSTLDTDYEGEIFIRGTNLKKLNKNQLSAFRNKELGFVFQFHYLLPEFTVLENVCIPAMRLKRYGLIEIKKRAMEKLDWLGIAELAPKRANQISGGQQQRVAIARALINEPPLIFGDEPTGNLDSLNAHNVFTLFRKMATEFGQTVVIVTHDAELAALANRKIVLKDGLVVT